MYAIITRIAWIHRKGKRKKKSSKVGFAMPMKKQEVYFDIMSAAGHALQG